MAQHARSVGPTTNATATFEPSMVQGACPDRAPARGSWRQIPHRVGWQTAQTTHVEASFAPNMISDMRPQRHRQLFPPRADYDVIPPDVNLFSVEMFLGSRPERARILLGPQIPLPVSQITHVAATFGPEMVVGWHPDSARPYVAPKSGWSSSQPTHTSAALSIEMSQGAKPERARPFVPKYGVIWYDPTIAVQMTAEMFAGSMPDRARPFLAPRLPLPLSQPTHVGASFSVEMSTGSRPDQPRLFAFPKLGGTWAETTFVVVMTPDMFGGQMPARARLFLGPRIPQPLAQTTHGVAPITLDMFSGSHPDLPRIFKMKWDSMEILGFTDVTATITATAEWIVQVRADVGSVRARADVGTIRVRPDKGTIKT